MSTNPFDPPRPTPDPLPPNRVDSRSARRGLLIWIFVILLFVTIHYVFSPDPTPPVNSVGSPVDDTHPLRPLSLFIPALAYGGMVIGLFVLRAKLPVSLRTFELRTHPAESSENAGEQAVQATAEVPSIHLAGSDSERSVRLIVDEKGIHWHADATAFLHGAAELHVAWNELQSVSISHGSIIWAWFFVFGAVVGGVIEMYIPALINAAIAIVLFIYEKKRPSGKFSFTTPTHSLTFHSRQIDAVMHERLLYAVRARNPSVAPKGDSKNRSAMKLLVLDPFVQFKDAFASNASLDAKFVLGANMDEETRASSRIQRRMFFLWSGTMYGVGPAATGLAAALSYDSGAAFFMGWVVSWVAGLLIVTRLMAPFARFTGMPIQQQ